MGLTVTATVADLEGSETDVAVSRTVTAEVILGGALYMFCAPLAVIACAIPPQEFTPIGQDTVQFTPLPPVSPLTVAEIGSDWFMSMV